MVQREKKQAITVDRDKLKEALENLVRETEVDESWQFDSHHKDLILLDDGRWETTDWLSQTWDVFLDGEVVTVANKAWKLIDFCGEEGDLDPNDEKEADEIRDNIVEEQKDRLFSELREKIEEKGYSLEDIEDQ